MFEFLFGKRNKPTGSQPSEPKAAYKPPANVFGLEELNAAGPAKPGSRPPVQAVAGTMGNTADNPDGNGSAVAGNPGGAAAGGAPPADSSPGGALSERKPSYIGSFSDPDSPLCPHFGSPRPELLGRSPRVLVSPEAYKRMLLYVEIAQKEVGWLGTVTRLANGDFYIDTTYLIEQEVTAVETELSVEGLNKLVFELIEQGDEGLEQANRLRFWGHSHVRMGTSPSGTDERTMDRFASEGLPWYVRGIFNKLGRGSFTIYFYELGFRINDAPWAVWSPEQGVLLDCSSQNRFGDGNYYRAADSAGTSPASSLQPSAGDAAGGMPSGSPLSQPPAQTFASRQKRLPPALVPSDALRAEVSEDFLARVSERSTPVFRWLKWSSDAKDETEQNGADNVDGVDFVLDDLDGNPGGGSDTIGGAKSGSTKGDEPAAKLVGGQPPVPKKGWSFWDWLFGSNSAGGAEVKPPVKPAITKPMPKDPAAMPPKDNQPAGPGPDVSDKQS